MTDAGHMEYVQTEIVEAYGLKKVSTIGAGGGERYESVWKALCTLMDREEGEKESVVRERQDGYVFIHDGAVPLSPAKSLNGHTGRCANAMPAWWVCP